MALPSIRRYCPRRLLVLWDRVLTSNVGSRLARGAFWSLIGTVSWQGATLLALVFVARLLGQKTYGELGILRSTVGSFGVFAGFGLGLTATKHVAEYRLSSPEKAGQIVALSYLAALGTGGLLSGVLVFAAPALASRVLAAPHLTGLLRFGGLLLILEAVRGAQAGALAGFEAFKTVARMNLVVGLASVATLVLGAVWRGLDGVVWALALNLALFLALAGIALHREARRAGVPVRIKGCWKQGGVLWSFSLPAALSGAMVVPVQWAGGAMLVNRPHGYAEMGVFSAAQQWYVAGLFVPSVLASTLLPILAGSTANSGKRHGRLLGLACLANALVVLPLVVGGCAASRYIMASYGPSFASAWPTLSIMLVTMGVVAIQQPVGQFVAASGRMWLGFAMNLGWGAVNLTSSWLLVSQGARGLATAQLVAYSIHTVWTFAFAVHVLRVSSPERTRSKQEGS